jgi:hypothetical protein
MCAGGVPKEETSRFRATTRHRTCCPARCPCGRVPQQLQHQLRQLQQLQQLRQLQKFQQIQPLQQLQQRYAKRDKCEVCASAATRL